MTMIINQVIQKRKLKKTQKLLKRLKMKHMQVLKKKEKNLHQKALPSLKMRVKVNKKLQLQLNQAQIAIIQKKKWTIQITKVCQVNHQGLPKVQTATLIRVKKMKEEKKVIVKKKRVIIVTLKQVIKNLKSWIQEKKKMKQMEQTGNLKQTYQNKKLIIRRTREKEQTQLWSLKTLMKKQKMKRRRNM